MKFLFLFFFLFSCIFVPIEREESIKNVEVKFAKQDETLFRIKHNLEDKFGKSNSPEYELVLKKSISEEKSGIGSDGITARTNLKVLIHFSLIQKSTGKLIFNSEVEEQESYLSEAGSLISEYTAKKSLNSKTAEELSNKIYNKIQNHFFLTESKI